MARTNSAESVRQHAIEKAKAGLGISSCPYPKKSPFQAVWIKAFVREAQLDWISAAS
ncbi:MULTISPECIES: hypothetical protein [unclassified Oleiphilus]|jgi:hypothetical protein|uniref:hypothetical protein n=1 Tax=unclassified Oleiphilus TaxID=2631174 RepID=UPI000B31B137|nr:MULTISPECIES: hypothetical protein [unclassified Oleiphilus]